MPRKKTRRSTARKTTTRSRTVRRRAREARAELVALQPHTKRQIKGAVQLALAAVIFLVLNGNAGIAGEAFRSGITFLFGAGAALLPVALIISGVFFLFRGDDFLEARAIFGLSLVLVSILGIVHIQAPFAEIGGRMRELGGAIGFTVSFPLLAFASVPVAYVVLVALFLIGIIVAFEVDIQRVAHLIVSGQREEKEEESGKRKEIRGKRKEEREGKDQGDVLEKGMHRGESEVSGGAKNGEGKKKTDTGLNIVRPAFLDENAKTSGKAALKDLRAKQAGKKVATRADAEEDEMEMQDTHFADWEFPSLDCLDPSRSEVMVDDATLKEQANRIALKLKEFDIAVTMRDAHPGPTVTQFTLEPSEGVKLSRIANLKNDLALALAAPSLRIEAPIPGKSLVGIEMPNEKRTTVHLREILESPEFRQSGSPLTLPFGRDVSGRAVVEDLADMPHLMIAGATGSGKSVCMNTFLTSLLYQNAPHELKFILIDPKRVELSMYGGIPHLLTPVITEAERALKALRWVVAEMGRRLTRFAEQGARNLAEYNEKQEDERKELPRIVVVIDELADLMMRQFRRDTEMMITRIAQIARATGIHLIVATQRPSVDVITGIIKANIPTRIAFRTVSSIDARTILDTIGAEDLLGKGDMLYSNAGTPTPLRVQGIFVSTKEVERVINQVKIAGGGAITAAITFGDERERADREEGAEGEEGQGSGSYISDASMDADDDGGDDLTFEAIELVRSSGKASASLLQRHLKVGYARAARILDILEEKGVVGPVDGAKPRKVYADAQAATAEEAQYTTAA